MAKNYYAVLGISTDAGSDEIRTAYRRLVKEYHPDRYSGGSEIFRQIQEAYAILIDGRERRQYDQKMSAVRVPVSVGAQRRPEPEPLIPDRKPIDFGNVSPARSFHTFTPSFDEIFDRLWSNFSNLERPKSDRVQNLTLEILITSEEAERGGNARIMVPARAICPACRGLGLVGPYDCMRCAGEGAIKGEAPISIAFPPAFAQEHAVIIPMERFGITNAHLTVFFRISE